MAEWTYAATVGDTRSKALLGAPAFDAIADHVANEMKILCYHLPSCDDDANFYRVVFCIQISPSLFDWFSNSPNGYRGAYYRSPYTGLEANDTFIQRIAPQLLDWAETASPKIDREFARTSLASPSAKVWLAEASAHLCNACEGEWSSQSDDQAEILNGRWENANTQNGFWGRKAPNHSKLRVFGAFVNPRYDVFIPTRKRNRAMDIHLSGWS